MIQLNKGAFITVEGSDGAGKSTQIEYIEDWLKRHSYDVVVTREPGGTALGEALREIVLNGRSFAIDDDSELLMMFAARNQHIKTLIEPALQRGQWVLSDRFTDATYAYQGGGREIATQRIAVLEQWVQAGLQPDLTLLLDVPVAVGMQRTQQRGLDQDRFEAENPAFKERVRAAYLARAKGAEARIQIIDASVGIDAVNSQLDQALQKFIENSD